MKIIFFGTPDYVVPIAEALRKKYNRTADKGLIGVVTQEPKPAGRKARLKRSEVDHWAYKNNVPIIFKLGQVPQADLGIVASYGKIIPQSVINKFKLGILNIHPSNLPEFRGASPVQATLATGKSEATVTVIKMDKLMDHGPIISKFTEDIVSGDTTGSLRGRLFRRSANFLIELIPNYAHGKTKLKAQSHKKATFTRIIKKEDAFIFPEHLALALEGKSSKDDWKITFIKNYSQKPTPENINNFIRAMYPWPTAWTLVNIKGQAKRLKLITSSCHSGAEGDRILKLEKVQLEGKNEVTWNQFLEGHPTMSLRGAQATRQSLQK